MEERKSRVSRKSRKKSENTTSTHRATRRRQAQKDEVDNYDSQESSGDFSEEDRPGAVFVHGRDSNTSTAENVGASSSSIVREPSTPQVVVAELAEDVEALKDDNENLRQELERERYEREQLERRRQQHQQNRQNSKEPILAEAVVEEEDDSTICGVSRKMVIIIAGALILVVIGVVVGVALTAGADNGGDPNAGNTGGADSTPPPTPASSGGGPTIPESTMVPTEAVSPMPTFSCDFLNIQASCVPPLDAASCNSIPNPLLQPICESRPFKMTFRYNGGGCGFSSDPFFECTDYAELPPTQGGTLSYITAFALSGGTMYFSGFVRIGEVFTMDAEFAGRFSSDISVTIYDPRDLENEEDITSRENLIQSFNFHSSCSQELSLLDRFASIQLFEIMNNDQGTVTLLPQRATIDFEISMASETNGLPSTFELTEWNVIVETTDQDGVERNGFDLSDNVAGVVLSPINASTTLTRLVPIDLTTVHEYMVEGTIVGETPSGQSCSAMASYRFATGG